VSELSWGAGEWVWRWEAEAMAARLLWRAAGQGCSQVRLVEAVEAVEVGWVWAWLQWAAAGA
jgi:hypothetical protein